MRCLGVGEWALPVLYNGPHGTVRRADSVACPACGKKLAPRKDGLCRVHVPKPRSRASLVGQTDEHLQREPVRRKPGRVVTQK